MTKLFHIQADGSLVCNHRDVSVCRECAKLPNVRDIHGAHFLMTDEEWLVLQAELVAFMSAD
jgi:hypothetical protein